MKNYLILLFLTCSFSVFSQTKKFSFEINYPINLSSGYQKSNGIADGSLKFRFLNTELFNFGSEYTFTYIQNKTPGYYDEVKRNFFFHHIDLLAELNIASAPKFHPYVSLGFTYSVYEYYSYYVDDDFNPNFTRVGKDKEKDAGYNFKIGLQYDLSSSFFLQTNFHYIRTFNKNELIDENYGINYNQIKIGAGFRF